MTGCAAAAACTKGQHFTLLLEIKGTILRHKVSLRASDLDSAILMLGCAPEHIHLPRPLSRVLFIICTPPWANTRTFTISGKALGRSGFFLENMSHIYKKTFHLLRVLLKNKHRALSSRLSLFHTFNVN